MAKDFNTMEDSNRSSNPSIHDVSDPARRQVLHGGSALLLGAWLAPTSGFAATHTAKTTPALTMGFKGVPVRAMDQVTVPEGYTATPLAPWGEPVGLRGNMPAFQWNAGNTADEQAAQMGMHHDGIHYYALEGSRRGLLTLNQEYTDEGLLHTDGQATWTLEKVRKSQNAHGITVIEIELKDQQWHMVRPSAYARRITAQTPFKIGGPAAGHALMQTAADPQGRTVLGTIGNCASGKTPWGTYLSGEENWANYFTAADVPTAHEKRWGINRATWYRWPEWDARFDTVRNPHEPNRFGWVVEVDPMDPTSTPVKRTALGRAAHEGAWVGVTQDGRAVVYSGEDARFEYIYKFVSRDKIAKAGNGKTTAQANATLLDHGTLYVARFDADGTGRWIPLLHGQGPLTAANGFADQGEVVIKTRQASDLLGATKMDRPEWLAIDPHTGWVYCTLTNNSARGTTDKPGPDAANPRANNTMGQIIRWKEHKDFSGETFEWNHLLLAGDPKADRPEARGSIQGDMLSGPDTIAFDPQGLLWIGTDMGSLGKGEMAAMGNNALLACNPATGEVRRFLTGPMECELTGATWTPDGRTLFVNIQHPGAGVKRDGSSNPRQFSNWPDFHPEGRPRSSTIAIRHKDGGVIGT
ncbi:MAG: Tat pathway signal protein [Burkholderiales bacterium PBB4]|nr:MAG: Tat pathway signal protein [Burkholderiales bacterium PBB4]